MVAPPPPLPQPSYLTPIPRNVLPSRHYCQTGELLPDERYIQDVHLYGDTPQERCSRFYQEYRGGKRRRRTRKNRTNKKSRKHRRKTKTRRY